MAKENAEKNNLQNIMEEVKSVGDFFTKKNISNIANFAVDSAKTGVSTFKAARDNAKYSGKILAHFL